MRKALAGILILLAAVAVVLIIASSGSRKTGQGDDRHPVQITFGYRPISPSLDFFVAVEKGYFTEAGIEAKLKTFRGSSDLVDAVINGEVDFASDLGMVTQLLPMMRTEKYMVQFLSLDLDALDSPMRGPTLVVKADSGISKVEDLRGKNVGSFPGVNFKIFLAAVLAKHGLDVDKDVRVIQIPPQEQMTGFASVDALISLDPITSGIQAKYGAKALTDRISARYIFDDFPAAASSVNADFAVKNPQVVAKVVDVLGRGIDFVRAHPDQTAEILAKYTNLPLSVTQTMKPVKYAKHDEIDVKALQRTCDYLGSIPWLNLDRSLDAPKLVWQMPDH